ncbi:capsid assembly protein [Nitrincola sp. A-D6]|uniref:capsid assembly protein n=1 Tax=Nitrincola sp. A-D6 TaxID=1545442 RepID=UPI0006904B27|nr:hypothetical protein [Nitrincola sp. A-D6]
MTKVTDNLTPDTPEYNEHMAAIGRGEVSPTGETNTDADLPSEEAEEGKETSSEDRPEWLPEEFETVEAFKEAYDKLKGGDAEETSTETLDDAKEELESKGLELDTFAQEYQEKGELTDESYAALEAAGIDRATVDSFIAGQEAQAELLRMQVFTEVGGEEVFNELSSWAAVNMSDAELKGYNDAVESGDMNQIKMYMTAIKSKYEAANGVEPSLLTTKPSTTVDAYQSAEELRRDMSDPRYQRDEAYRNKVASKLARSQGNSLFG